LRHVAILLIMFLTVSTACALGGPASSGSESGATSSPAPRAAGTLQATPTVFTLTPQMLANLEYSIGDIRVSLANGAFNGQLPGYPGPGVASMGPTAFGDLDNDGVSDAAAIVFYNTIGTTGHFSYLEAVLVNNGKPQNAANVFLGDRERIETMTIVNGEVVISLIAHAPGDGGCCPSVAQTWRYRLQSGKWVQLDLNHHY